MAIGGIVTCWLSYPFSRYGWLPGRPAPVEVVELERLPASLATAWRRRRRRRQQQATSKRIRTTTPPTMPPTTAPIGVDFLHALLTYWDVVAPSRISRLLLRSPACRCAMTFRCGPWFEGIIFVHSATTYYYQPLFSSDL